MTLPAAGTLQLRLAVPDGYWPAADTPCRFPPVAGDGLYLEVVITVDRVVEVFVDGPLGRAWSLATTPLPHEPSALALALTWDATEVVLYLDGERVAESPV